jgi:DNA-binding protein H-NS
MATYKEIQAKIEDLQRQAAAQRQSEMSAAVQRIREMMQEYGISANDLLSSSKKGNSKKSGTVQFRNAETGDTWSGRGRMPNWLSGKDKEQFRV